MTQRALVIEPNFSGHRWRYVKWTMEALVEAGFECTLSTDTRNRTHELIRQYESPQSGVSLAWHGNERISSLHALLSMVKEDFAFHALFASAYRAATRAQPVNLVVVPYGDYVLNAVAILGSPFGATRWMCITMRQFFHLREMGVTVPRRPMVDFVKKRLFLRALRLGNIATVLSIDPTLALWHASSPLAGSSPRVEYLADPFPETIPHRQSDAKARLGITADRSILVYGAISERKGIGELLNACMTLDDPPLIIVAGQQDDRMRAYLASISAELSGSMLVFDRFIPPEMEADLFSACDAVWVGYRGHYGMSGVLVQAYRFGKTAIATSTGLIGWFAKHDQLGPLLSDLSVPTIKAALADAIEHWTADVYPTHGGGHSKLLAQNTVGNFKRTIGMALAQYPANSMNQSHLRNLEEGRINHGPKDTSRHHHG